MLADWSPEYVKALFESDKVDDPIFVSFESDEGVDHFLQAVVPGRSTGLSVVPVDSAVPPVARAGVGLDHPKMLLVTIESPDELTQGRLLDLVRLAPKYGGTFRLPGALEG
ncbi:hypothetical protein ABI59_01045 [Acidobacteria bacterium Mor1]|nr:hypothetical protein ABI59_01045 [Acidobacteria bacterium Mor1]